MTQEQEPSAQPLPPENLCPSCGRFTGPYATCPHCGAQLRARLSLRLVKGAALLLATLGLLGLWWVARATPIATLAIADVQGTMNMAYVRIEGRITRSVSYDPEGQYLAFWVADETGELRVAAYRDVTQALLAAGRTPAVGDRVRVAGSLRVREDYVSLTVNTAEHLELERPAARDRLIGQVTAQDEGARVHLVGEVSEIKTPYAGMTLIDLRDASGEITVAVDEATVLLSGAALPEIIAGQPLEVIGAVTLYRDTPQIAPARVADVTLLAAATPTPQPVAAAVTATLVAAAPTPTPGPTATPIIPPRALDSLTTADVKTEVRVQGRVVAMEGFKGGLKATLDDGSAQLIVLLWERLYTALETPAALDVGAEITVWGEISEYEGELEITPQSPTDITLRQAAPEVPWVEIGQLTENDAGRLVRLRGVLGAPEEFSAGVKAALDDGSGKITLLLWSNVAEKLTPAPAQGLAVEVIGVVEVYRGKLELIPRSPLDWRTGQ